MTPITLSDMKQGMRTPLQILARLRDRQAADFFGFEIDEYLQHLPFDLAKEFLKPEATAEEWAEVYEEPTRERIVAKMTDYMPFAFEKANDRRGISAGRSIQHYVAWLWLIGEDDLASSIESYEYYGKPQLCQVCELLGINSKQWDDGERTNGEYE